MIIKVDTEIELKQLEKIDAKAIFAVIDSQREYLGKWLPFVEFTKELTDSEDFVDSVINASTDTPEYVFTMRKSGAFVGLVGINNVDKLNRKGDIGYWLSENYQKQGIVSKSVKTLVDYAFNNLKFNRLQIKCAVGNTSSRNIPRKLGFVFEGIERQGGLLLGGIFADLEVYSLLKSDK